MVNIRIKILSRVGRKEEGEKRGGHRFSKTKARGKELTGLSYCMPQYQPSTQVSHWCHNDVTDSGTWGLTLRTEFILSCKPDQKLMDKGEPKC